MDQDADTTSAPKTPVRRTRVAYMVGNPERLKMYFRIDPRDRKRLDRLTHESRMNQSAICTLALVAYLDNQDKLRRERSMAPATVPLVGPGSNPVDGFLHLDDEDEVAV